MFGLDTNILVRFITKDEPRQSEMARGVIESAEQEGRRLHISTLVLVELVWVLRGGVYGFERAAVAEVLDLILESPVFRVQDRDLVRQAVVQFRRGAADFSDYLIGEQDRSAGCTKTLTFDRRLAQSNGFEIPDGGEAYPSGGDLRVSEPANP